MKSTVKSRQESTMKSRLHKLLNQSIEHLDKSNNKPIREMSIHKSDRINHEIKTESTMKSRQNQLSNNY